MAAVIDLGEGWLISHEKLLNSFYKEVECNGKLRTYEILKDLFKIVSPYKNINALKSKRKCGNQTDSSYKELIETVNIDCWFPIICITTNYRSIMYKKCITIFSHNYNCY